MSPQKKTAVWRMVVPGAINERGRLLSAFRLSHKPDYRATTNGFRIVLDLGDGD